MGVSVVRLTENDGLVAVGEHPVFQVVAQAAGEDGFLDVLAVAHHVVRGIRMVDADDILLDDGPLVQLGGHVVAGGADQLDAPLVGLVVGLGADEAGEEAVVDVDDLARVGGTQVRREDLHVASEDDGVAAHFFHQSLHFRIGGGLVVGRHGHVVEGDAVPFDETLEGVVIGDDAGNLDVQFLGLPAGQQIVEAVLLLGHHHHNALLHRAVTDLPVHLQRLGYGGEAAAEFRQHEGQGIGLDLDAHEVATGKIVGMETGFEDPAAMLGNEAGDAGDDAHLVGTGGGEGVEAVAVH